MAEIKDYQSSVNWDSPEAQAKKRALRNAWLPEDVKVSLERSSNSSTKVGSSTNHDQKPTEAPVSKENNQSKP